MKHPALKRFLYSFIIFSTLSFFHSLHAAQVAGIDVPPEVTVGNQTLTAQGAALRSKFFFDVYVAAFYAVGKARTPSEALALPGPKRMWFRFLRVVPKNKFIEAWQEGFANNNSAATLEQNKKLINIFLDLFDNDMANGDIMTVDYIPNKGTQVSLNGKVKGTISGEHFYSLVLSVWMGEHPPNQQFQKALLSFN